MICAYKSTEIEIPIDEIYVAVSLFVLMFNWFMLSLVALFFKLTLDFFMSVVCLPTPNLVLLVLLSPYFMSVIPKYEFHP